MSIIKPRKFTPRLNRLLLLLLLLSASFLMAMLAIAVSGMNDQIGYGDVIIVPGNTVGPDGKPSPRLKARLEAALMLFREQRAQFIFVSGGIGKEGFDEAESMSSYLIECGVPRASVIRDNLGVDTAATAKNAALFLKAKGLHTALVATQYFHVPRTILALERNGIKVTGNLHPHFFELRDVYSVAREVVAYVDYAFKSGS